MQLKLLLFSVCFELYITVANMATTTFPLQARDENVRAEKQDSTADAIHRCDSPGATGRVQHLPHHCTAYADEIIDHLLSRERTLHRDSNYLSNQDDVTERMRIILMDWLVDVHQKFKLHPETFFLAVDYVDRYLMVSRGTRSTLQLVGVSAILLAAKHEEIWPPEVRECIYISANTYTREDILTTERSIASALNFRLCTPTPYPFMTRVLDCTDATEDVRNIASYCLDIAALDYASIEYLPSRIGFAAVLIANTVATNTKRQSNAQACISAPRRIRRSRRDLDARVPVLRQDCAGPAEGGLRVCSRHSSVRGQHQLRQLALPCRSAKVQQRALG